MKKLQDKLGKGYDKWFAVLTIALLGLIIWSFDTCNYYNYRQKQEDAYWKIDSACSAGPTEDYGWVFDETACRTAIENGEKNNVKTQSCKGTYLRHFKNQPSEEYVFYDLSPVKKAYRSNEYGHYIPSVGWDSRENCVDEINLGIEDGKTGGKPTGKKY
ncbi:hypothetical protein IIY68_01030 [Candidatus Saccharibacteria bacterium]|nr:hypothetical protein [Candidatus Saccharibacteria bacterium]